MSWADTENALHAWVVAASGLAAGLVRWGDQAGISRPVPPTTWVELRLGASDPIGVADETRCEAISMAPGGSDVSLLAIGRRASSLAIQVFGPSVGAVSARALAGRIQGGLALESIAAALSVANVSVVDNGSIVNVPRVLETDWQGRAVLTVRFHSVEELTEITGSIAIVNVELPNQGLTVTAP